jgi:hypothetical protein
MERPGTGSRVVAEISPPDFCECFRTFHGRGRTPRWRLIITDRAQGHKHATRQHLMATIRLLFAFAGLAILIAVIVGAVRNRENDRLGEGLLIGIYVGVLGSISLLAILMHCGLL